MVFDRLEAFGCEFGKVCFEGKEASQAAVDVFNSTFFGRAMRMAEVGFEMKGMIEFVMVSELDAIVLGEGSSQFTGQGFETPIEVGMNALGSSVFLPEESDETGRAFLQNQDVGFLIAEEDEIGFEMPWLLAGLDVSRPFIDGNTVFDVVDRARWRSFSAPPFGLGFRQVEAP